MSESSTPVSPRSPLIPDTLQSVTALARFEFEPGKGNEGTKVMMVEWQDDDQTRPKIGKWHVSWTGKRTVFPADDTPSDNIRRVYFLLPPGAIVPPHVTLAYHAPGEPSQSESTPLTMTVNPLPAIFTPELGATAKASGRKGVLHTIWAKKRMSVLEKEIKREEEFNLEGVALEMAISEKLWIEANFGLATKPPALDLSNVSNSPGGPTSPSLISPRSPGGRRLSEKLQGLSLGTSEKDLAVRGSNTTIREDHPLSPEASDVANAAFGAFRPGSAALGKKVMAQAPPDHIKKQQESRTSSLDVFSDNPSEPIDDDLFAVGLSPRSPDDPKSPFSLSSAEVGAFSRIKGER